MRYHEKNHCLSLLNVNTIHLWRITMFRYFLKLSENESSQPFDKNFYN